MSAEDRTAPFTSALARIALLCLEILGDAAPGPGEHVGDRAEDLVRCLVERCAERQKAADAQILHLWELLDSLDPAPERPVEAGHVDAVEFIAIRDRIAARLAG